MFRNLTTRSNGVLFDCVIEQMKGYDMTRYEFGQLVRAVSIRAFEIDEEHQSKWSISSCVGLAANELVPDAAWRDVISLCAQGAGYYGFDHLVDWT